MAEGTFSARIMASCPTPRSDFFCGMNQALDGAPAHVVLPVPDVERQSRFARDHIRHARLRLDRADRGHKPRHTFAFTLHERNPFRRRRHRIAAEMHRCGACVIRSPHKEKLPLALPGNRLYYAKRQSEFLQYRALFDMKLDITENISF